MCWAAPTDLRVIGFQTSGKDFHILTQYSETLIYLAGSSDTNLSMGIQTQ